MKNSFLKSVLTAGLLAFTLAAPAEDIDLFVGATSGITEVPNVLIVVDNTANWNSAFTNETAALAATVSALPADKFRVGIMFANETGSPNNNTKGGYVRAAVRLMDSGNKTKYQNLINSFTKLGDKGNGGIASLVMAEAYRYLSAGVPYGGNGKVKTDYTGNTSGTPQSNAVYALTGNALGSFDGTRYVSPITSGCQKTFIIYLSNGASNDDNSVTTQANSMLTAAGGATTPIPISPSGSQDNASDEWARFMKKSSLGVTTYTIDVDKVASGQGPGWTALLKSMAGVSSGKYFDVSSSSGVNGAQISAALGTIFSEIQAVNSVFASVSLPVSVSTQGTYLNQVYVGMFRPDQNAFPRWAGNLKQYKIGYINNVLKLQDADSADANNNQTGFITECARSFWTPATTDSYWAFKPQGGCLAVPNSDISNYPDGSVVEKGGQAYKLRSVSTCTGGSPTTCTIATPRTVKTCSSTFASCTSLTDFNNTNVSAAMLTPVTSPVTPTLSTTQRDALINWEIGQDVDDENNNGQATTEMRPYAHGDVVHSRPLAFNFSTDASPQVVVFYSGNDGMLRAINGNRPDKPTPNIGTVTPGSELWEFVAPEFYPQIKRIHDNTTQISFRNNTTGTPTPLPKPYGIDGPITGYQGNISGSPKAFIYATMRRGGRALYAFDVTTPASPTLKWKKGCPNNFPSSGTVDDTNCTTGFSGIGQTWSPPHNFKSAGYGSGISPMLIMGGGYDTCEDADPHTCTSTKGNKVYVMDADSGALLKTLDTDRGVAGDVTVVPDQTTGLAEYAYATDLGGNIYRISGIDANTPMGSTAPGSWTITKVASLGTGTAARKFMFSTDVVKDNGTYLLLVGSGDREKPLLSYTTASVVTNYFFMVKDKPTDATWLTSENATCAANVICLNSLTAITTTADPAQATLAASKGWYLGLSPTEQVVTSAITLYGVVTFSTHQPAVVAAGSCGSNLGQTRVYNINYQNAAPSTGTTRYADLAGDGLPPSPVLATVTLDDGRTVTTVFGSNEDGPIPPGPPPPPVPGTSQPKSRVYWHIQQ
jgi:type IV pilus assembly protein PilY1